MVKSLPAIAGYDRLEGGYFKLADGSGPYFLDSTGTMALQTARGASGVAAVVGAFAATTPIKSAAFIPLPGRAGNISIWGTFVANLQLYKSFDGGTTLLPITAAGLTLYQWSAPASEQFQEDEVGVSYYLGCAWTSGTVNYRVSQ